MSRFWRHFITDGGRERDDAYFGIHGRRAPNGVEVRRVEPESPAEDAGILEGDVVVGLAGRATRSVDDLHDLLADLPSGMPLPVRLVRRGRGLERWVSLRRAGGVNPLRT